MHTWLSAVDVAVHRGTKDSDAEYYEAASSDDASCGAAGNSGKSCISWRAQRHDRLARTRAWPHGVHNWNKPDSKSIWVHYTDQIFLDETTDQSYNLKAILYSYDCVRVIVVYLDQLSGAVCT